MRMLRHHHRASGIVVPVTLAGILGAEPGVYWHADDAAEDDGDPVASLTGRTTYDATGIANPVIDDDGWNGTHKTINITGSSYLRAPSAAAAAHGTVGTPCTWLLACTPTNSGSTRVLMGLGNTGGSFPFKILHVGSGSIEFWSSNGSGEDAVRTTGAAIENLVPSIFGVTYNGATVTVIQRTASGDVTLIDNEPHAPIGSAAFNTMALGVLYRNVSYGQCPLNVRCKVELSGAGVSVPTLIDAMDYIENQDDCPV